VQGALLGRALVPHAPQALLKLGLGVILNLSAWRIFHHTRRAPSAPAARP
jgi:hypothetical protein